MEHYIWGWKTVTTTLVLTVYLTVLFSICPGRDLADLEIWYAVATILATQHIELAPGERKKAAFQSGTIRYRLVR